MRCETTAALSGHMGAIFSKKKAAVPEPARKPSSAPARLEGLDGTSPSRECRASTPLTDAVGMSEARIIDYLLCLLAYS